MGPSKKKRQRYKAKPILKTTLQRRQGGSGERKQLEDERKIFGKSVVSTAPLILGRPFKLGENDVVKPSRTP